MPDTIDHNLIVHEVFFTARQGVIQAVREDSARALGTPEQQEILDKVGICVLTTRDRQSFIGIGIQTDTISAKQASKEAALDKLQASLLRDFDAN